MSTAARAIWHPSPNFGPRRNGAAPDLIVLHYTAMVSAEAALARMCDPTSEVSAHFLLGRRGRLWRLVNEDKRAWHAGAGSWGTVRDVNSHAIGIEIDNDGLTPFPAAQIDALEVLLSRLMADWHIPPERVIAHSDMAPTRKSDPGARFDWRRLARNGLSVWPDSDATLPPAPHLDLPLAFQAAARGFGYPEVPLDALLVAFRQRFRPWAHGPLATDDLVAMTDLARRYPVDRLHQNA